MFVVITYHVVMVMVYVTSISNLSESFLVKASVCLWDYYGETCDQLCTDQDNCNNHGSCVAGGTK